MEGPVYQPTKLSSDRSFHQYYNEVGRTGMLSPEEERKYAVRYVRSREAVNKSKRAKLDVQSRDKLINNCLRSVVKIAAQYSRDPDTVKDLISAGNLGVFHALNKYDPTKCTRFLSYAIYWIQFYIREELYDGETVSMPRWRQKAIRKMRQVNAHYISRKGRKADDAELCAETDLSPTQLERLRKIGRLRFSTLDSFIHLYTTAKEKSDTVFNATLDSETKETLARLLTLLGPKENFVVRAYFGMCTDPMSLHQIAKILGVSSERVRQVKVDALKRLARYFRKLRIKHVQELCG